MSEKNEENIYLELLKGRRSRGRYKNSNLVIVDTSQKSIEERTKNNISPPTNLNPDYSLPVKIPTKKQKRTKTAGVDSEVLQTILRGQRQ